MESLLLVFVILSIAFCVNATNGDISRLSAPEILVHDGYPHEEHFATTTSGYILRLHRIPHGRSSLKSSTRPPVYLQHGLLSSSIDWLILGPEKSLAYLLADNGYDVWMGNARGNTLSRNHTTLDPDTASEFWDFSWHEIGLEDVPTMIDYILEQTRQNDLFYVGHSQGTTSFYVMASTIPEYNKKIRAHFSLAPIAYMKHLFSPVLQGMSRWSKPISALLEIIGVDEYLPNNPLIKAGADVFCRDRSVFQPLCTNGLFMMCGFSPLEMNTTLLPIIAGHSPAGAATKQILHYAQEIKSGHFRQFDYGLAGNLAKYKLPIPPDYEISAISSPVYLFYSTNDWMSSILDVNILYAQLQNAKKFLNTDFLFNHLDYLFGIHARENVYEKILELMNEH